MKTLITKLILSCISLLAPIHMVMTTVGVLIFVDLFLGIWAALKRKEEIKSSVMRRTISKILIYQLVVISAFLCETYLFGGLIPACKLAASVIGLVELKSILENADSINGEPLFKKLIQKLGSDNDKPKE